MSLILRAIAGLASVVPLLGAFVTAAYCAWIIIREDMAAGGAPFDPVATFVDQGLWQVVLGASIALALFQVLTMIGFMVHALTRKHLTAVHKALWVAGFYLFGIVVMPVYFLMYMLRDEPEPLSP